MASAREWYVKILATPQRVRSSGDFIAAATDGSPIPLQASFLSEMFPSNLRYSGASLGYQLASITAGGPAPIIALYLYRTYQTSMAVAAYVALTAVISLVCVWLLPDRAQSLDPE